MHNKVTISLNGTIGHIIDEIRRERQYQNVQNFRNFIKNKYKDKNKYSKKQFNRKY
jgi:hypothetical protein